MTSIIEETSTLTTKGQTTVPKAVRQALGLSVGGKIAFRIEGDQVTLLNAEHEHRDPALEALLALVAKDIAAGRNVGALPDDLAEALKRAARNVDVDLSETLDGDVAL